CASAIPPPLDRRPRPLESMPPRFRCRIPFFLPLRFRARFGRFAEAAAAAAGIKFNFSLFINDRFADSNGTG
ncbi:hypothetical protein, partial [Deinococcus sp.]|uniref:hypothetical protein n=1 Tax=Deinococcus sp. TaxID=47478 RepID=UPI0025BC4EF1